MTVITARVVVAALLVTNPPGHAALPQQPITRRSARNLGASVSAAANDADAFAAGQGNVLVLDHLNANHQKGRHDLLQAFYKDVLGLALDPRKAENVEKGRKTLWFNAGVHQFHCPEAECAQVFDGRITLAYEADAFASLVQRLEAPPAVLGQSAFGWESTDAGVSMRDPWGSQFELVRRDGPVDARGEQAGPASHSTGLLDLTVHVPSSAQTVAGISRFYQHVLGCVVLRETADELVLQVGPTQTLTFRLLPGRDAAHDEVVTLEDGIANNGVHLSLYVRDFRETYVRADELGVTFVNHRFKRRAYCLDDALEQCMFRILEIRDPLAPDVPIMRLEHEVRSTVTVGGSKYKSCPFFEVPGDVVRN